MPPAYTIHVIPYPLPVHSLTPLAEKLRKFKLHALLSDPKAFSQNHATESSLPISAWETRVANPDFRIVVCVVADADDRDGAFPSDKNKEAEEEHVVQRLLESEWAGTFTLVGPVPLSSWLVPSSGQPQPGAEGAETRWHLTSLFVLPAHRGCGLASKLTLAAVRAGSSGHQVAGNVGATTRFRLIVHPKNIEVVKLYEKLGFVKGGLYTQREAMVAMGDAAGVPEAAAADIWDSRLAIGMERLV
ncbi:hypothetical protein DM02DRAFT_617099 [Periconia macrospinosa]|uniref:N-acetyltransferase domain-containing protein n=1 Tax=Periconia macrospinosa TaxID=97972 RepID=A0A2V1DEM9_9PLEO|nr:hypothetical protein DM02DRAFT_617099 [Periconia macrospinosa]